MITQTNVYFGETKPSEYMLEDIGVRVNSDIRYDTIEERTGWFATSNLYFAGDDAYLPYKRMIEMQATNDEQDELIAEIIEGGA